MTDITLTTDETLVVDHETLNRGDATDTQDIRLTVDGTVVDTQPAVELEPDGSRGGQLSWSPSNTQIAEVCVVTDDGRDCIEVEVTK